MSSKANTELVERLLHPQVFPRVKRKLARLAEVLENVDPLASGIYSAASALPVDRVPPAAEFVPFVENLQPKIASDRDLSRNLRELADRVEGSEDLSAPELLVDSVNAQMRKLHQLRAAGLVSREQHAEAEMAWEESLLPFVDDDRSYIQWFDSEFIGSAAPEPPFLVQDFVGFNMLTILTGPGAAGKGRLMTQLAVAIASGEREWIPGGPELQHFDDPARALIISTEDDPTHIAEDIREADVKVPDGKLGFVHFLHYTIERTGSPQSFWTQKGLSDTAHFLLESAIEAGTRFLVLDHKGSLFHANENDRQSVNAFLVYLNHWAMENQCSVVLLAHPPKGVEAAAHGYSGSTEWSNVVRCLCEMGVKGEKDARYRFLRTRKASHGRKRQLFLTTDGPWWAASTQEDAVVDYMEKWADEADAEAVARAEEKREAKKAKEAWDIQCATEYAAYVGDGMPQMKAHAKVEMDHYPTEVPSDRTLRRIARREGLLA